jgi:hypothetical protein
LLLRLLRRRLQQAVVATSHGLEPVAALSLNNGAFIPPPMRLSLFPVASNNCLARRALLQLKQAILLIRRRD